MRAKWKGKSLDASMSIKRDKKKARLTVFSASAVLRNVSEHKKKKKTENKKKKETQPFRSSVKTEKGEKKKENSTDCMF